MNTSQFISLAMALAGAVFAAPQAGGAASSASAPAATGSIPSGNKVPGQNTLTYCKDPSNYAMNFDEITVDPLPPQPGQNVTITIKGNLKTDITAGAQHKVSFGTIENGEMNPFMSHTQDLCKGLDMIPDDVEDAKKCPIAKGPFTIKKTHQMPERHFPMPSGEFFVRGSTTTADGQEVVCMIADLKAEGSLMGNGN